MFDTSGGIADARVVEVAFDLLRPSLSAPEIASYVSHELPLVARTLASHRVGLDVLVEEFVRIEVRAVAGQEEQAEARVMTPHPPLDLGGHVHGMLVDDEKYLAPGVAEKSPPGLNGIM